MTKDLKNLLAALTESERDAILEHDADSRLGRLVLECRKPKPVEVPYWAEGEITLQQNSTENLLLYLKTPLMGEVIYPETALKLARALIVGAMALEGVEAKNCEHTHGTVKPVLAGCALSYIDDLLTGLGDRT